VSENLQFDKTIVENNHLKEFVPPPRFGATSFAGFLPQHKSQELARDKVSNFVKIDNDSTFRWPWQSKPIEGRGLYLDGGFGVGKTHLLAAAFYAFRGTKIYLSFSELVYLIGVLGRKNIGKLANYQLYCIDEFELDDPGNTLIVKSFLEEVFANKAKVITTSNTIPEAQGKGRFNAEDFKRDIQGIANSFDLLSIDGPDYRKRDRLAVLDSQTKINSLYSLETDKSVLKLCWEELFVLLRDNHPINYRKLLERVDVLLVDGASPIILQVDALRFVHFIDKLYDLKVGFRMSGDLSLADLFDDSYVNGAYAKKHYRCLSRISELLEEKI